MAARAAEKCVERWCNAFDIQFRIFQDFLMWLERLCIMKTSTNCIRAYSALLQISHMIAPWAAASARPGLQPWAAALGCSLGPGGGGDNIPAAAAAGKREGARMSRWPRRRWPRQHPSQGGRRRARTPNSPHRRHRCLCRSPRTHRTIRNEPKLPDGILLMLHRDHAALTQAVPSSSRV